jgi:hypothetical protein
MDMEERKQVLLSMLKNLDVREASGGKRISFPGTEITITSGGGCIFNPNDFIQPPEVHKDLGLGIYIGFGQYHNYSTEYIGPGFFILTEKEYSSPFPNVSHHVAFFMVNPKEVGFTLVT